jgi:hypothetical protein
MTISVIGSNTVSSAAASFNLDMSGIGMQADDILYVWGSVTASITMPRVSNAGFVLIFSDANGLNQSALYRKVQVEGALDTSVTCIGNGSNQYNYMGIVFRNVDQSVIEDAVTTSASGSSANPDSPSITTVTDNALVMSIASTATGDSTVTDPPGYTRINGTSHSFNSMYASYLIKTPAGAEDPGAWTNWSSGSWFALTVALRPAITPSVVWLRA